MDQLLDHVYVPNEVRILPVLPFLLPGFVVLEFIDELASEILLVDDPLEIESAVLLGLVLLRQKHAQGLEVLSAFAGPEVRQVDVFQQHVQKEDVGRRTEGLGLHALEQHFEVVSEAVPYAVVGAEQAEFQQLIEEALFACVLGVPLIVVDELKEVAVVDDD